MVGQVDPPTTNTASNRTRELMTVNFLGITSSFGAERHLVTNWEARIGHATVGSHLLSLTAKNPADLGRVI